MDGKALARCGPEESKKRLGKQAERHLETLAAEAGVRPLMDFLGQDPEQALAMLEDAGVEPPPGSIPPIEWYAASDGSDTVRGLLTYLASNPGRRRSTSWSRTCNNLNRDSLEWKPQA